jgi:hypothetical protein
MPALPDSVLQTESHICIASSRCRKRRVRHADLTDKGEPGFDLAEALCPKIEPGSMMSQRAVANFDNGLDESVVFEIWMSRFIPVIQTHSD